MQDLTLDSAVGNRMSYVEIERRYPRLLKRMQQCAILAPGEAISAINDVHLGLHGLGGGCEAVAHYGGARKVITQAFRQRRMWMLVDRTKQVESLQDSLLAAQTIAIMDADVALQSRRMVGQLEAELHIAQRRVERLRPGAYPEHSHART